MGTVGGGSLAGETSSCCFPELEKVSPSKEKGEHERKRGRVLLDFLRHS
jgi:hypothetical protein